MHPLPSPSAHTLACLALGGCATVLLVGLVPTAWASLDPLSRGVVVGLFALLGLALTSLVVGVLWARHQASVPNPEPARTPSRPRFRVAQDRAAPQPKLA